MTLIHYQRASWRPHFIHNTVVNEAIKFRVVAFVYKTGGIGATLNVECTLTRTTQRFFFAKIFFLCSNSLHCRFVVDSALFSSQKHP